MAVTVIYLPENFIIGVIGAVSANPTGKKVYHEVSMIFAITYCDKNADQSTVTANDASVRSPI